jgi:hypothetical protein
MERELDDQEEADKWKYGLQEEDDDELEDEEEDDSER